LLDRRSGLRRCDLPHVGLDTWIGRVEGLESRTLPPELLRFDCRNNRLAELALTQDGFDRRVLDAKARYGASRVGLFVATSTSGIGHTEQCYRRHLSGATPGLETDLRFAHTHTYASLVAYCLARFGLAGPAYLISTACSSSAKVLAAAHRHMAAGLCDAAVVGGVDSLCATTLYGFAALGLVSPRPCRPWDAHRDGISIGEAAGFALLERAGAGEGGLALLGYGESSDAYHISSPHPEGLGASLAIRDALQRAGLAPGDIDYVNLHGTGTRANDRSEDKAVAGLLGHAVPASSTKGWTGHALGAAGITEAIFCLLALRDGFLPASLNLAEPDPALSLRVLRATRRTPAAHVLSNSFGFGGSNCCLVLGRLDGGRR
jgi:3-oxoacyl-[acyl-carrier-protein] synthase-1